MTRLRDAALTVGAVLGGACLLVVLMALFLDVRTLVFRSGSMGPDIPAGSVALARSVDAADLRDGDVVSVLAADGTRVTHRIVQMEDGPGRERILTLRGDANSSPDPETYAVSEADRVFMAVPGVGHVIAWCGSPVGLLALGALGGALLAFALRPARGDRGGGGRGAMLITASGGVVVLALGATSTAARFSDSGSVISGPVAAHTVRLQGDPQCEDVGGALGALGSAEVSWSHVDRRYVYDWTVVRQSDGVLQESGTLSPDPSTPAGTEVTQAFATDLLALDQAGVNLRVEIRPRLRDGTWTTRGDPAVTTTLIRTANLLVGLSVRCGNL